MKFWMTKLTPVALLTLSLAACGGAATKPDGALTKSEARALVESGDADDAVCTANGFEDDGVCDEWCPSGDGADCELPDTCEDGENRPAPDGCNTCTCSNDAWACTEMACGDDPDDTVSNDNNEPGDNVDAPDVLPLEIGACDPDTDPLNVSNVKIAGDRLFVDIGHGGGCAEHTYRACWEGSFLESNPVQANIVLEHDANGDMCEAYLQETLEIDLTPMRENYEMGYPGTDGIILLGIGGEGATYSF